MIELQVACDASQLPSSDQITAWAEVALQGRQMALTIRLVEADEIVALNSTYRNKHQPTNVLSFPADFPEIVESPYLGDIAICTEVVADEARQQGKKDEAHWAHMVIHGVLHLRGYDHIDTDDAEEMESLERTLLAELGYDDPYTLDE